MFGSTFTFLAAALVVAGAAPWWPLRLLASVVGGLLLVRGFIIYHDFMHGALLRKSRLARGFLFAYGTLVLTPPRVWRQTHNYHHAHTCKIVGSHIGSFPVLTVDMYRQASWAQRLLYRIVRHPLTVVIGYLTIFLYGMCVSAFLRRPRGNWDSGLALLVHVTVAAALAWLFGIEVMLYSFIGPLALACAVGAYLFYAQHNFEGLHIQPRDAWAFDKAALESSSYMDLGPVGHYFTGNIGYHHVHHLNPHIPFYRLPAAHRAVPELQSANVTTLKLRDIAACFRLKLWDPDQGRMVGYP